jgi:hypothetical protein
MNQFNIHRADNRDNVTSSFLSGVRLRFNGKQYKELFQKHKIKFITNDIPCIVDMINLRDSFGIYHEYVALLACRYSNVEVIDCLLANGVDLMNQYWLSLLGYNGIHFVAEREDDNGEVAEKVLGNNDFDLDTITTAAKCNNIKIFKFLHQKALAKGYQYGIPFEEIELYKLVEILDYFITRNYITTDDVINLIDNDGKCFEEIIKNRIDDGHLQFSDNQLLLLREYIDV